MQLPKILLLDNYDSFTFNIYQVIRNELKAIDIDVIRNDQITTNQVERYDKLLFSPGPGLPEEAGLMPEIIAAYKGKKPMLGVCLGHQAIAQSMGASLYNMKTVLHGIQTDIFTQNHFLFDGIDKSFKAGRYHSWMIDEKKLNPNIEVIARDDDEHIMAISIEQYSLCGLQFHPESIMTENGARILKNWVIQ